MAAKKKYRKTNNESAQAAKSAITSFFKQLGIITSKTDLPDPAIGNWFDSTCTSTREYLSTAGSIGRWFCPAPRCIVYEKNDEGEWSIASIHPLDIKTLLDFDDARYNMQKMLSDQSDDAIACWIYPSSKTFEVTTLFALTKIGSECIILDGRDQSSGEFITNFIVDQEVIKNISHAIFSEHKEIINPFMAITDEYIDSLLENFETLSDNLQKNGISISKQDFETVVFKIFRNESFISVLMDAARYGAFQPTFEAHSLTLVLQEFREATNKRFQEEREHHKAEVEAEKAKHRKESDRLIEQITSANERASVQSKKANELQQALRKEQALKDKRANNLPKPDKKDMTKSFENLYAGCY